MAFLYINMLYYSNNRISYFIATIAYLILLKENDMVIIYPISKILSNNILCNNRICII